MEELSPSPGETFQNLVLKAELSSLSLSIPPVKPSFFFFPTKLSILNLSLSTHVSYSGALLLWPHYK